MSTDEHGTDAGPSLEEGLAELTPDQAQRALLLFFDSLPREGWQGGKKPSPVGIETLANELQEKAPDEIRPLLRAIRAGGDEPVNAEVARQLLLRLARQGPLRPYLEMALGEAREPRLDPLPAILGAYVLVLAAMSTKIEIDTGDGKTKTRITGGAVDLIRALTDFVKALPASIWRTTP
jgi:hypothetical protein